MTVSDTPRVDGTDRITLADIGTRRRLPALPGSAVSPRSGYIIESSGLSIQILTIGYIAGHAGFAVDHPCILERRLRVLEFKHYRGNSSKFWTRKPGLDLVVAVRSADCVFDHAASGSTFPVFRIGGEPVKLNVGGGTCGDGDWSDWIGYNDHTCVNLPLRTLRAILAHALTPEAVRDAGFATLDVQGPSEYGFTRQEDQTVAVRSLLLAASPTSWLAPGMSLVPISGTRRRDGGAIAALTVTAIDGVHKQVVVRCAGDVSDIRIPFTCCDWAATANANGVEVPMPMPLNRLSEPASLAA